MTPDTSSAPKGPEEHSTEMQNDLEKSDVNMTDGHPEASSGVKEAEAVKHVMSTSGLVVLFSAILLITFSTALQQQVMYSTLPYVYSDFSAHSLIPTTAIVANVVAAIFRLPLAKVLNIWGRAEGFAVMLFIYTIGVIMMAACQNVVAYSAASVFLSTGFDGIFYVLYVVLADNFSLKNRGFMFGLYNAPYLVTTWIGAPIADQFLAGAGWRWSYGVFAIIAPATGIPVIALLLWNYRTARMKGFVQERTETRNAWELIKHYWVEFDCVGLLLISIAFSLTLLPFSLYTMQTKGWASPTIICMLVFGVCTFILFGLWEKYGAAKTFMPFELLKDRTIVGGSIASANTFLIYFVWCSYFSSHLQVVQGLSITLAGYVNNIHSVGWVVAGIIAGALIKTSSRYKWIALYAGAPLQILAMGLMYHISRPDSPVGLIVMAQIFLSVADGLIYLTSEVAVLAVIEHEHIAVVLAVYNMITSLFTAVGSTISAGIWTNVFPKYLARYLPESAQPQIEEIYSSIYTQLSFEQGTAEREAIAKSYSLAMQDLFIAGLCLTTIGIVSTAIWKNVNLGNHRTNKQ